MKHSRFYSRLVSGLTLAGMLLLSSCGKSLDRTGAMSLLESIVDYVGSSSFVSPTSYSVETTAKGNLLYDGVELKGNVSESVNFSFSDSYYHLGVTVAGKTQPALTLAYTSENWIYVDITQASGANLYLLVEATLDGTKEDQDNKTYSLTDCSSLEEAQAAFLNKTAVAKESARKNLLSGTPQAFHDLLGQLQDDQVTGESYSTTDDYDVEMSVSYTALPSSTSESASLSSGAETPVLSQSIKIKNGFLLNHNESDGDSEIGTAYSWGRYKPSKPDLGSYRKESSPS